VGIGIQNGVRTHYNFDDKRHFDHLRSYYLPYYFVQGNLAEDLYKKYNHQYKEIFIVGSVKLDYFLPNNISYNQNIPTPASVIGHEIGDWHITHDKLVQYMYVLAESSDRISIENRGETFEGRPLLLLYISAPNNLSSLEKIRENHISLTENGSDNIDVTKMQIGRAHV
jgi:hypothetical protein